MTEQAITAAQMRSKDQFTINQIGIPSLVLMERASLAVRDAILTHYPAANKIVVVAGQGNNGPTSATTTKFRSPATRRC